MPDKHYNQHHTGTFDLPAQYYQVYQVIFGSNEFYLTNQTNLGGHKNWYLFAECQKCIKSKIKEMKNGQ